MTTKSLLTASICLLYLNIHAQETQNFHEYSTPFNRTHLPIFWENQHPIPKKIETYVYKNLSSGVEEDYANGEYSLKFLSYYDRNGIIDSVINTKGLKTSYDNQGRITQEYLLFKDLLFVNKSDRVFKGNEWNGIAYAGLAGDNRFSYRGNSAIPDHIEKYNSNGHKETKELYFNDNNQPIRIVTLNTDTIIMKEDLEYDHNQNLVRYIRKCGNYPIKPKPYISKKSKHSNDTISYSYQFIGDTSIISSYSTIDQIKIVHIKYKEGNNSVHIKKKYGKDHTLPYQTIIKNNKPNGDWSHITKNYTSSVKTPSETPRLTRFTYYSNEGTKRIYEESNKNGVKKIIFESEVYFQSEYDKYGNIIKKQTIVDGLLTSIIEHRYIYY